MLGNDLLKDLMADLRPDRTRGAIYGKTMDFPGKSGSQLSHLWKNTSFSWTPGSFFDPHVIEKKACFPTRAYVGSYGLHVGRDGMEGHPYAEES